MTKEARIYNGKRTVFKTWCWNNWTFTCKKMNLTLFIKINSKWIMHINVNCKTIKLLKDNIGANQDDLG